MSFVKSGTAWKTQPFLESATGADGTLVPPAP